MIVRPYLTSNYELADEMQPLAPASTSHNPTPLYYSTAGKHWLSAWYVCRSLSSSSFGVMFELGGVVSCRSGVRD